MVLFSSLYEPYKAAFLPIQPTLSSWEWFVDATFYVDILLSFWTGFDRGYTVVMARQDIVKNYLNGWFAVDVLATVEWDLLIGALIRLGNAQQEGGAVMLRLTRLLKVLRIVKAPRLIMNLTKSSTIHTAYIDAVQFFALVLIVAHNLGCFFFMVPALFVECVPARYVVVESDLPQVYGGEIGDVINAHTNPDCMGECGICHASGDNDISEPLSIGIIPGSWRENYDVEQMAPQDQYVDALYWSLTTMTTIGYGDRSPHPQCEVIYTMIAEVLGLSFFAMLLNEISILQEVAGRHLDFAKEQKNTLVSFMRHNDLDAKLVQDVIAFLNFRAKGHTGRMTNPEIVQHVQELSMPLQHRINQQILLRPLREVALFGHSKQDADEARELKKMFDDIDEDGGGSLDKSEILALLNRLKVNGHLINSTTEQVELMMYAMARSPSDVTNVPPVSDVNFEQFHRWWYTQQHGREIIEKCPQAFLLNLANAMSQHIEIYGRREQIIGPRALEQRKTAHSSSVRGPATVVDESCADYGQALGFVLGGTVVTVKNVPRDNDVVAAAVRFSDPAFATIEQMDDERYSNHGLLLCNPDRRGRVVPGSVNLMFRTCKVTHLESNGSPVKVKDHNGAWQISDAVEYHLTDVQVVERNRPRHFVHHETQLQPTPGKPILNSSHQRPSTAERCAITGMEYGESYGLSVLR